MKSKRMQESRRENRAHELGLDQFAEVCDGGLDLDTEAVADEATPHAHASVGMAPATVDGQDFVEEAPGGAGSSSVAPMQVLEAMLFVDEGPLYAEDVAALIAGLSVADVRGMMASLAETYTREGRPYELVSAGGGTQLRLREGFLRIGDRLYQRGRTQRLSPAAVEVLALVAYRQPVGREQIEGQRGSGCGALLRQLVQRGVLCVRREGNHRQAVYETTPHFLQLFGLKGLDELPRAEDLEKL